MRSYQSVLILKPDIEETRVEEALVKIDELIKSNGGAILKTEKWGKKRLAYRVKKNRFGVYLNLYHTLEPAGVIDLEKKYKLFDLIIKFMVLSLADDELERALGRDDETDEAEGEKAAGEKAKGEKVEGEKATSEKVTTEKAEGEKATTKEDEG